MPDPNFIQDIWELAKSAGPFGAAFAVFMWYRADTERRASQKENKELLERTLTALNLINELIRENSKAIMTALLRKDN